MSTLCGGIRSRKGKITQKTQHSCQRGREGSSQAKSWHCTHEGLQLNPLGRLFSLINSNVCRAVLFLFVPPAPTHPSQSLHPTPLICTIFYFLCFTASLCSFLMFFRVFDLWDFMVLMSPRLSEYKHRLNHNKYITTDKSFDYTDSSVGGSSC